MSLWASGVSRGLLWTSSLDEVGRRTEVAKKFVDGTGTKWTPTSDHLPWPTLFNVVNQLSNTDDSEEENCGSRLF